MLAELFNEEDQTVEGQNEGVGGRSYTHNIPRPKKPRNEHGFVGLENQGATCYLNALLQVMYMTPELRNGLYLIDPKELGVDYLEEFIKQEKEKKKSGEIEANEEMVQMLLGMGIEERQARGALVATKNASIDAALDYALSHAEETPVETPAHAPAAATPSAAAPKPKSKNKPRMIPLELQSLFAELQLANVDAISTESLTSRGFQWQSMDGRIQHDAHELNRLLIDALERSLKHTAGSKLCQQLYQGQSVNRIQCQGCRGVSERCEHFYDCNIQVADVIDICSSLHDFTSPEKLEGDSAYSCDQCGCRQPAVRNTLLRQLPPVLTFSCNRFRIDKSTNWQRQKITTRCSFPLYLDMTPFAGERPLVNAEDRENVSKETAKSCLWVNDVWSEAMNLALEILSHHADPDDPVETLGDLSPEELQKLHSVAKSWQAPKGIDDLYRLEAVIMHRGSAHAGHYFAYIRDSLREGNWSADQLTPERPKEKVNTPKPSAAALSSPENRNPKTNNRFRDVFIQRADGSTAVSQDSILGKVVEVFQLLGTPESDSEGVASHKLALKDLGEIIRNNFGGTWASLYKEKEGTLLEFLNRYDHIFRVLEDKTVMLTGVVEVVSSELFKTIRDSCSDEADEVDTALDEELAKSLQNEENKAEKSPSDKNGQQEQNWEVAGKKKKPAGGSPYKLKVPGRKTNNVVIGKRAPAANESAASPRRDRGMHSTPSPRSPPAPVTGNSTLPDASATTESPQRCESNEDSNETKKQEFLLKQFRLANRIVAEFHGCFFEFNDSQVTPMPLVGLEKAFEGEGCAYILVYKRVSNALTTVQPPPRYWIEKVDELNQCLQQKRLEYEEQIHSRKLAIYCPIHLLYRYPLVFVPEELTLQEHVNFGAQGFDKAEFLREGGVDPMYHACISLTVDARQTVGEITNEVKRICGDNLERFGLVVPGTKQDLPIGLSELTLYGKGYHPGSFLDTRTSIGDCWRNGGKLLAWNGLHVCRRNDAGFIVPVPIDAGWAGTPIRILVTSLERLNIDHQAIYPSKLEGPSITLLLPPNEAATKSRKSGGKPRPIEIRSSTKEVWYPQNAPLNPVYDLIADESAIDPRHFYLNMMYPVLNDSEAEARDNPKLVVVPLCWSNSGISPMVRHVPKARDHPEELARNECLRQLKLCETVSDLIALCSTCGSQKETTELLIEDNRNDFTLCELEVVRRNSSWTITVDVTFDPLEIDSAAGNSNGNHGQSQNGDSWSSTNIVYKLEVIRSCPLYHLKRLVLEKLKLKEADMAPRTRFRRSQSSSKSVFQDESLSLEAANLCSGSSIILELGKRPSPRDLCLRVCVVFGNDSGYAFNPKQPGIRDFAIDIECCSSNQSANVSKEKKQSLQFFGSTVRELRDFVGQNLLGLESNWTRLAADSQDRDFPSRNAFCTRLDPNSKTVTSPSMHLHYRLRLTNWQEESGELLQEVGEDGKDVTLEAAALQSGTLLLLEEGDYPVRGRHTFSMFLWAPWLQQPPLEGAPATGLEVYDESAEQHLLRIRAHHQNHLLRLDQIYGYESETLLEFQERSFKLMRIVQQSLEDRSARSPTTDAMCAQALKWILPRVSLDQFLLREVRIDLLPGRCLWTTPAVVSSSSSMDAIGRGRPSGGKPAARGSVANESASAQGGAVTLKKIHLLGDRSLAIELLFKPASKPDASSSNQAELWNSYFGGILTTQQVIRPPAGAFRIWAHQLMNPEAPSEGLSRFQPAWPPVSITINAGMKPTVSHLRRALAECFSIPTQVTIDRVAVYKWSMGDWAEVVPGLQTLGAKSKTMENITQPPYSVKEGDIFCFFVRPLNDQPDKSAHVRVSRPEDLYLRLLRDFEKQLRKEKKHASMAHDPNKQNDENANKKRIVEVGLFIGGDLDFSEDEEDAEHDETASV